VPEIGAILIWTQSHFAARLRGNAIMSPSLLWRTEAGGDQAILRPAGLNAACAYRDIHFLDSSPARIATKVLAHPKSEANWRDVDTKHLTSNGVVCRSRPVARLVARPLDAQQSAACNNRSQLSLPLLARQKAARIASCPKSGEAWVRVFIYHLRRELRGAMENAQSVNAPDRLSRHAGAARCFAHRFGKPAKCASPAEIAPLRAMVQGDLVWGVINPLSLGPNILPLRSRDIRRIEGGVGPTAAPGRGAWLCR
jgi:hypothetical protein